MASYEYRSCKYSRWFGSVCINLRRGQMLITYSSFGPLTPSSIQTDLPTFTPITSYLPPPSTSFNPAPTYMTEPMNIDLYSSEFSSGHCFSHWQPDPTPSIHIYKVDECESYPLFQWYGRTCAPSDRSCTTASGF